MNNNNRKGIDELQTWQVQMLEDTQKEHGMKEKIYYITEKDGTRACVVLLAEEGPDKTLIPIARGVSVCSKLDAFDRAKGRVIARGRALRAVKKHSMTSGVLFYRDNHNNNQALGRVFSQFGHKSAYRPKTTEFEDKILAYKPKKEK